MQSPNTPRLTPGDYLAAGVLGLSVLLIRGCAEKMDKPSPDEPPKVDRATEPTRETVQISTEIKDKTGEARETFVGREINLKEEYFPLQLVHS